MSTKKLDKSAKKKIEVKPELQYHPVTINGTAYKLCLDKDHLAEAEDRFNREGYDVNLIRGFGRLTFSSTRDLFAASLHAFHPEIGYRKALEILTLPYALIVGAVLAKALTEDLPEALADAGV